MIDQNILYADCPCGSGKKFKFCIDQGRRVVNHMDYEGPHFRLADKSEN